VMRVGIDSKRVDRTIEGAVTKLVGATKGGAEAGIGASREGWRAGVGGGEESSDVVDVE
jgi:hypothetical protein